MRKINIEPTFNELSREVKSTNFRNPLKIVNKIYVMHLHYRKKKINFLLENIIVTKVRNRSYGGGNRDCPLLSSTQFTNFLLLNLS